jgi:hypothetical protein
MKGSAILRILAQATSWDYEESHTFHFQRGGEFNILAIAWKKSPTA